MEKGDPMQTLNTLQVARGTRTKLVITDVDGTMSSFWDYFVPAIRDYLREISQRVNVPVSELAQDIGHIIERRGTHEYPWLLEETSFAWKHFGAKPDEFIADFVKPFWEALDNNRAKYLRPFPNVLETLAELKSQGIQIVALSDAPEYMARTRNKQVFDGLLDAVYALETVEPGPKDVYQPISLKYGRERVKALRTAADTKTRFQILPQSYEKPCPNGLDQVLKDFGVFPQEALFIGDSLSKDGMVAASRGIRFVWAHYGHHVPAEYEEMVNYSLKPRREEKAAEQLPSHLITAVAARYEEVLNHI
ncbi:MAG: HAD family hydrolase [Candidatus Obscuribacterales bacterium]